MSFQEYVDQLDADEPAIDLPDEFVISLDGGGVRCVLQLGILERLIEVFPQLLDRCTLLAGTSAGSFVALGLAHSGLPLCHQLFSQPNVQAIFARSWAECVTNGWGTWRPRYDPSGLQAVLTEAFGAATLGDLRKRVLVSSFDLEGQLNRDDPRHHNYGVQHWSPKFYDNYAGSAAAEPLVELALRSSAAPCYFPSHAQYVDGGVVANNPSVHAISRLVQLGNPLTKISVLSLGSGNNPFHVPGAQSESWGLVQWAPLLLNLVMDAPSEGAVLLSQQLLGARYHRCNPILPQAVDLDDASQLAALQRIAAQCDLLPTIDFLYKVWFPELPPMLPAQVELQISKSDKDKADPS